MPGLEEGLLGLSILGDLGGAFSNWQQQQRQRDIYKKLMDPNAMAGYANTYANNIYNTTSPQIARQAASSLGAGGVSQGGYGNALMQQALAQYMGQLQQEGANAYTRNLTGAANSIGPTFGTSGASMDALKTMMMLQALQKNNPTTGNTNTSSLGSPSTSYNTMPMSSYRGSPQLDFGFNNTDPFTSTAVFGGYGATQ